MKQGFVLLVKVWHIMFACNRDISGSPSSIIITALIKLSKLALDASLRQTWHFYHVRLICAFLSELLKIFGSRFKLHQTDILSVETQFIMARVSEAMQFTLIHLWKVEA